MASLFLPCVCLCFFSCPKRCFFVSFLFYLDTVFDYIFLKILLIHTSGCWGMFPGALAHFSKAVKLLCCADGKPQMTRCWDPCTAFFLVAEPKWGLIYCDLSQWCRPWHGAKASIQMVVRQGVDAVIPFPLLLALCGSLCQVVVWIQYTTKYASRTPVIWVRQWFIFPAWFKGFYILVYVTLL